MSLQSGSIKAIKFFINGSDDIRNESCVEVNNKNLFSGKYPVDNGPYDAAMGTTELEYPCNTCKNKKDLDPGHDGHYELNCIVQNDLFKKEITKWLNVICYHCGEILGKKEIPKVSNDNKLSEYKKLIKPNSGEKNKITCLKCNKLQPHIYRDKFDNNNFKIISESSDGKDLKSSKVGVDLSNEEIAAVFNRISEATIIKLGKDADSHPKKLLMDVLKVPTNVIRPEIRKIGGNRSTTSDTTAYIRQIIDINNQITKTGLNSNIDQETKNKIILLQSLVTAMISGKNKGLDGTGISFTTSMYKTANSIASRIVGKQARIRGNLMGKRTTKMGRSVVTGDRSLKLIECGVPESIARTIPFRETVRPWNRERLTAYYMNGRSTYPGCQRIKKYGTNLIKNAETLKQSGYVLEDGDVVYRDIIDGDPCAINREPSLKYSSIIMLKSKILPGDSLRINSVICPLFNADFDKLHCRKQTTA